MEKMYNDTATNIEDIGETIRSSAETAAQETIDKAQEAKVKAYEALIKAQNDFNKINQETEELNTKLKEKLKEVATSFVANIDSMADACKTSFADVSKVVYDTMTQLAGSLASLGIDVDLS